jgi:hemin uptake protein HemP
MHGDEAIKLPRAIGVRARQSDAGPPPRIASSELLGAGLALVILHNGREYVLRVTQNGKLILTA